MRRVLAAFLAMAIPLAVAGGLVGLLFHFAAPQPQPSPLATRKPSTATVTPSDTPTATIPPSATPQPTPTPRPTVTPQPTDVPTVTPTETQTLEPTATVTPTEIPPTPDLTVYGEVMPFELNLRSGPPGTEFRILYPLRSGDRLEIIGQAPDGTYLQVVAPDGTEGWVDADYVVVPDESMKGVPIVEPSG